MQGEEITTRHRVLIVDDEESMRLLMAAALTKALDVEVQLAGTCEQALRLAQTYAYDAILLDLRMPGIGGFGVLSGVRRSAPNARTPVIIVSALLDKATVTRCQSAGANAFVSKPLELDELADILRQQLAARTPAK
ncbi:MAG TPA: response regulator [Burkholderiales bacterium]|nr:response regulator [Burkholderiales bacterium]